MSEFEKYSFRELINKLVSKHPHLRLAEVKSVDRAAKTCDAVCLATDMELSGTRLMAILSEASNRFVIYPKVGSVIMVAIVDGSNIFVMLQAGEIDGMELNGDAFSMVKGEDLREQINRLKGTVDALVNGFNSWVPPVGAPDSGAALKAAMQTALTGRTTGDFSGILNEKVKHG